MTQFKNACLKGQAFFLGFLFLFLPLLALCQEQHFEIENLLQQSNEQQLAFDPYWHKLLHYRPAFFGVGVNSAVISQEYFLSKNGKTDPQGELESTIRSFFERVGDNINNHPQCRFVSRFQWLKKKLNWDRINLTQYKCPKFEEWTQNHSVKSLSLIFATGYLGNPGSFFGHPLLKFNFKNGKSPNDLLDVSVSYGAFTPLHVNPFVYPLKGLLGGYDAGFTHLKFYYNNHNYTENELRDLWEYELDLTDEQVEQIVSHAWDLMGHKFPYYFLSDNCASRMSELLEMVIDSELIPKNALYSLPYVLFDRLVDAKVVRGTHLIPSRQTKMTHKFQSLNKHEQEIVNTIIYSSQAMEEVEYKSMSENEKVRILETLFDYDSYKLVQNIENHEIKNHKKKLLLERLKLPPGQQEWPPFKIPAPHFWQKSALVQFSFFHSKEFKNAGSLRWRPAYYDILALDMGELPNGSISAFDMQVSFARGKIWPNYIDLIDIQSLNLSQTDLPGDGGMAWNLKIGLGNQDLSCMDCLNAYLTGGVGKGVVVNRQFILYGMLNPRIQSDVRNSGNFAVGPEFNSLIQFSKVWKVHLSAEQRFYLNGDKSKHPIYLWENRFGSSRTWDVRVSFKQHVDQQLKASYSYYW